MSTVSLHGSKKRATAARAAAKRAASETRSPVKLAPPPPVAVTTQAKPRGRGRRASSASDGSVEVLEPAYVQEHLQKAVDYAPMGRGAASLTDAEKAVLEHVQVRSRAPRRLRRDTCAACLRVASVCPPRHVPTESHPACPARSVAGQLHRAAYF
jgi:hypothetical protein